MAEKYVKLNDIIDTLEHEWGYEGMREDLQNLPTADVVEVKHGYLEHIADFGGGNCFGYCSICHAEHKANNPTALKFAYVYCRWCGAKMDGTPKERGGEK